MILGDVDSGVAEECSYAADDPGDIEVREYEQRSPRRDVDCEIPDACQPWTSADGSNTCDDDFVPAAAKSDLCRAAGIITAHRRYGEVDPARLGQRPCIHKVESN